MTRRRERGVSSSRRGRTGTFFLVDQSLPFFLRPPASRLPSFLYFSPPHTGRLLLLPFLLFLLLLAAGLRPVDGGINGFWKWFRGKGGREGGEGRGGRPVCGTGTHAIEMAECM
jgi:hypothetical protein